MAIAPALLQGVEQAPEAIPCFFAALLLLAGAFVLLSGAPVLCVRRAAFGANQVAWN